MSFAGANDTPLGQSLEEVRAASTLPNITEKKEKYYLEIKKGWRDGLLFSKRIKGAGSEAQQDPTEQQIDEPPALQASETQQDAATRAQEASVERQIEVYCKWIVEVNKTNVSLGDLSLQDYVIEFFQYVTGFKKNVDFELALSIHASYEQLWEQTLQQFQTLETSSVAEEVDALRSLHDLQCLKQFVDMSEMATLLDMQNLQLLHEMLQSRNVGILNYLLEEHNLQQMQAQLQLQDQQQLQETLGYLAQLQRLKSIETLKLLQDTEMLRKLLMVQYLKTELSSKNLQALRSLLAWQDVKTLVVLLKLQVEQDVPNSMQEDAPPVPTTPVELPTTPIILQEGDQPKHSYIPGSKIEVDTYQIAVPNGDCSIHLLVQRWESGSVESNCPGPCGLIHRAILVDGGNAGIPSKYGIMASWIIRMTIDKIQQDYYQVTSALDKTPRRMGRFNRLKFDAWVVTHWDADHYMGALQVFCGEMAAFGQTQKCSYFRYDGDIPATILYCPSWSQGLDQKQPINLTITEGVPQTDGSFIAGMRVPDKYHTEKGKNELKFITRENVLRVRAGKELIWRDFWTDTALGNISTITDLKPLPQHEDWPLFVCVGANGDVFHGTKQSPYRKTEETPTNWSSIINLLYWPQQQYQNISMYWAGDAVDTVETRFAEAAIEAKFFGQKNVSIMKLSHHGSSGSTPNALLEVLKPKHFVVSAGGQYGHPKSDILKRIREHVKNKNPGGNYMHATRFPYWLRDVDAGDPDKDGWETMSILRRVEPKDPRFTKDARTLIEGAYFLLLPPGDDDNGKIGCAADKKGVAVHIQHLLIRCTPDNSNTPDIKIFAREAQTATGQLTNVIWTQSRADQGNKQSRPPKAAEDPTFWGADDEEALISKSAWEAAWFNQVAVPAARAARAKKMAGELKKDIIKQEHI